MREAPSPTAPPSLLSYLWSPPGVSAAVGVFFLLLSAHPSHAAHGAMPVHLSTRTFSRVTVRELTFSKHNSLSTDISTISQWIAESNTALQEVDRDDDVACPVRITTGNASILTFGDPYATIDTGTKFYNLRAVTPAAVKLVQDITWCNGPRPNAAGCSGSDFIEGYFDRLLFLAFGRPIPHIVLAAPYTTGRILGHEFGHTVFLQQNTKDPGNFMYEAYQDPVATPLEVVRPEQCRNLLKKWP